MAIYISKIQSYTVSNGTSALSDHLHSAHDIKVIKVGKLFNESLIDNARIPRGTRCVLGCFMRTSKDQLFYAFYITRYVSIVKFYVYNKCD